MITLDEVYDWLNQYDKTHISSSSGRLVKRVCEALEKDDKNEARGLLHQLADLSGKLREEKEVTEILVECARCFYQINNLHEADTILTDATSRAWSDVHRRAVIQWMLGWVKWQNLAARTQAVITWRNSLTDFQQLAKKPGLVLEQRTWYEQTASQLEHSLIEALDQVGSYIDINENTTRSIPAKAQAADPEVVNSTRQSPGGTVTDTPASTPDSTITQTPFEPEPVVTRMSDILQLFNISEEIPAGDFGPSGIDPFPIGTVEIDRLAINGHPYSIHSTRGRKLINLPFDQKFIVVKVKGDSMNLENISEQDYVLLRRVDSPSNGDIVLAEVVGVDSHATLKKYTRSKDAITLSPHSSNPAHQPFIFKRVNEGFYIRGVVVAVLKPE